MTGITEFRNKDNARKLVLFDGLNWNGRGCTDIDVACDFNGKLFVFAEVKYGGAKIPTGQRRFLEGLVDAINANPATKAIAFRVQHNDEGDVLLRNATVTKMYGANKQWIEPQRQRNFEATVSTLVKANQTFIDGE